VNVLVDLDQPHAQWAALGDGFRVETRILVWQADSVIQAPAGAIFRQGDGWAAYRVENGRARLRPARIGRQTGARVQIVDGLAPGDQVVVYPGDLVEDGRAVRPREGS
jgi:HlyD family secretion protein